MYDADRICRPSWSRIGDIPTYDWPGSWEHVLHIFNQVFHLWTRQALSCGSDDNLRSTTLVEALTVLESEPLGSDLRKLPVARSLTDALRWRLPCCSTVQSVLGGFVYGPHHRTGFDEKHANKWNNQRAWYDGRTESGMVAVQTFVFRGECWDAAIHRCSLLN